MSKKSITMNKLRNRVQLIGHLGMNPEVKTLESGTKLAKFSLATNDSYVNTKGEKLQNLARIVLISCPLNVKDVVQIYEHAWARGTIE